jgi:hypothetical protein
MPNLARVLVLPLALPFALWLAAPSAHAAPQNGAPPAAAPKPAAATKRHAVEHVAIIGASLSEGYEAPPGWGAAFEASFARAGKVASNHSSSLVFADVAGFGLSQAALALEEQPTLLLAVDYLFWFGYGAADVDGKPVADEAQRLAMLERGLKSLEKFECPIVLGDFPDMSEAVGRILMPTQMPKSETLGALNARLREWAAPRANVIVIGLSSWVEQLKSGKAIQIGPRTYDSEVTKTWLQDDRLHPTLGGLAALATLVHHELAARKFVAASDYHADAAAVLERVKKSSPVEAGGR